MKKHKDKSEKQMNIDADKLAMGILMPRTKFIAACHLEDIEAVAKRFHVPLSVAGARHYQIFGTVAK